MNEFKEINQGDTIYRQAAIEAICEGCYWGGDCPCHCAEVAVLKTLPSAEPKTMDKTNANKIYNHFKKRIGDAVDDIREYGEA